MNDDTTSSASVVIGMLIVTILCSLLYLAVREKESTTGYITKLWWDRTVYELEDYQTYECHIEEEDDGNSNNNDNREITKCAWVTHTRTTNRWQSSGSYPLDPYWPIYQIAAGRYESKTANYYFEVKTDKHGVYTRSIGFREYQLLKPEKVLILHLNYFNSILRYEVK